SVPNDPALGGGTIFTWAVGMLTCATPTGTFAQQISHLETLRVKGYSSVSGPDMHFENGVWVMYYHAEEWANSAPDNIYRAISTTLAADAWTPLANSSPVIRRAHAYEAGLAADASVAQGPGGSWFAAWSSLNNRTSRGSIMLSPMLPSLRQWDGEEWQPAQRQNPSPIVTPEHALWRIENHMPWAGVESYSGGWTLDDNPGGWGPRYYSSGQGNYIAYDVILAPGTWRLEIFTQTGPVQADLTVDVDNGDSFWNLPTLGVLSCYAASTTAAVMVGPLTFTLAGSETVRRILRFSALTRNAANTTGWWTQLQGWVLRRVS
ncbi:MAG TPA: hypothetical protein VFC78_22085, partial [Tepidisphaeraceae bacterium]|nr:hypothetical protein [Tepidisphaeraceae bacterium]